MGSYLKCPKCNSTKVEIAGVQTKTKINWWGCLIDKNAGTTKRVHEQKKHCKDCGYFW